MAKASLKFDAFFGNLVPRDLSLLPLFFRF
jgi:hypothetical protein